MAPPRIPIEQRFWAKVEKADGCWLWKGAGSKSGLPYGRLSLCGRGAGSVMAHRFSFEIHKGQIPQGMMVCHACDNPRCVNPDHLFLGTHEDNMLDRNKKGRAARQKGEKHGAAILTDAVVREIRNAIGLHKDIAKSFGVHKSHVSQIKSRKLWAHVE